MGRRGAAIRRGHAVTLLLPPEFAELEPFVETWGCADFEARFAARYESSMDAIRLFYEAVVPRLDDALAALDTVPLDKLEGPSLNLYRLALSATHVALAVERHGQPRPAAAHYPVNLRMLNGSSPA